MFGHVKNRSYSDSLSVRFNPSESTLPIEDMGAEAKRNIISTGNGTPDVQQTNQPVIFTGL
jgi:hypothetical protein